MTKEQAYEILGLDSSATDTQIKRKYANCARRAKFDSSFDMYSATEAFDLIMGYSWGNFSPDPRYTQKGFNIKKAESFFYLHTRALIYSIAVFLVLISIVIVFFATKVNSDYSLTVIGSSIIKNQEVIHDYYEELLDVDEVLCSNYTIGDFSDNEVSLAGYWWLYQDLAGGDSNIFILPVDVAKMLSSEGAVKDLTPFLEILGISEASPNIVWWEDEDGNNIAAAYYFNESDILNQSYAGKIPDCFSIPFRMDVDELTMLVMKDFVNNGK